MTDLLESYLLIGDERVADSSGGTFDKRNPATGDTLGDVSLAGPAEIDRAVATARAAFVQWRTVPGNERRDVLLRMADLLERDRADFTQLAALETGIPSTFGGGIDSYVQWFRYYAGWADKIEGQQIPVFPRSGFDYTIPEPWGVIALLIPWNFPMGGIAMTVPAALAAGNCIVLKPPELGPYAALRFGELAIEAGLPPGVLNVVPAGPDGGDALVRHPGVDKISFTGSGATARKIMAAAAENLTPMALELGGKSANIVFADADVDAALKFSGSVPFMLVCGQGCVLPTRMLVERPIYDDVLDQLVAIADSMPVGDPLSETSMVGPVISAPARERIMGMIGDATSAGAGRLLTGGTAPEGGGYFVNPTVLGDVDPASTIARDEVFGPVLVITPFTGEDEAVALANDSVYGLGAYLHTNDLGRAHRLAGQLDAGSVNVNGFGATLPSVPFGGVKQSGFGREGGRAGLDEFLRPKNVFIAS